MRRPERLYPRSRVSLSGMRLLFPTLGERKAWCSMLTRQISNWPAINLSVFDEEYDCERTLPDTEPAVLSFHFRRSKWRHHYLQRLYERHPFCTYCRRPMRRERATLDHVVPRCQNGAHTPQNLVLCCADCNQSKAGRSLVQWVEMLMEVACTIPGETYFPPVSLEGTVAN